MTPLTVTPQSPAPLTLTVRSPRLGVACRHAEGPATLRGTPDRWRIDFGAAPDITPVRCFPTAPLGALTATATATILFNPVKLGWVVRRLLGGRHRVRGVGCRRRRACRVDPRREIDVRSGAGVRRVQTDVPGDGWPESKPCWEADGGDTIGRATTPAVSLPLTMVVIAKHDNADTNTRALVNGGTSNRALIYSFSGRWHCYNGNVVDTGDTDDAELDLFTVYFRGAAGNTVFELTAPTLATPPAATTAGPSGSTCSPTRGRRSGTAKPRSWASTPAMPAPTAGGPTSSSGSRTTTG